MRKKLLVSFSGGETSAFMAQWLWRHKQDEYEMIFVFANTGQENEETLEFVKRCEAYFSFPIVWIEANVFHGERKGSGHQLTSFDKASRNGEPFEEVIKKYGIPNSTHPHCTREAKQNPIHDYISSIGWEDYYTAIGIRADEADRMAKNYKKRKFVYPLISSSMIPMSKPKINFWWSQQDFRLELKGYEGNCKWCWKKSDKKLFTIAKENENAFEFPLRMEEKYDRFIPESRMKLMKDRGEPPKFPITFFRKNRSTKAILEQSRRYNKKAIDDSKNENFQLELHDLLGGESCEIYAECGS